jgi:hypothetical protein
VRAREKNIVKDITGIIKENRHAIYLQIVTELADDYGLDHIAAAGLCAAFGEIKEELRTDVRSHNDNFDTMVTAVRKDIRKTVPKSATSNKQKGFYRSRKNQYQHGNNTYPKRNSLSR